jgi:type IV pilus assembly protein PilC
VNMSRVLTVMSQRLRTGGTLVEALEATGQSDLVDRAGRGDRLSQIFEQVGAESRFVETLSAVEQNEDLPQALEYLARTERETEAVSRAVESALLYPRFVFTGCFLLGLFLVRVLGGQLSTLFSDMSVTLHPLSRFVFSICNVLRSPLVLVFALALVVGGWLLLSNYPSFDKARDRVPWVGDWCRRRDTIVYFSWLEMGLNQGMTLPSASRMAASACQSPGFRESLLAVSERLENGDALSEALGQSARIPAGTEWLVSMAEKKELKDGSLGKVAEYFSRDLLRSTERALVLLEPALLVFLGFLLGTLISGYLLPLYQAIGNLG